MRRFQTDPVGDHAEVVLSPEQSHHLLHVLRLGPGARILLSDNSGFDFVAVVEDTQADGVRCRIEERRAGRGEMCVAVTVYQAVIKGDRFDYAVQKMTEGGVSVIVPFLSARCVKRPKNPERFVDRAQRIAEEAAKQCERSRTPEVADIAGFEAVVAQIREQYTIFACEREDRRTLRALLADGCPERAAVVIGPEGGFTEEEKTQLLEAGAHPVTLGERILRSETAGLYVLAQLDYACCSS